MAGLALSPGGTGFTGSAQRGVSRGLIRLRRALLAEAREQGWREWNGVEGHQAVNVDEGATAPRKSQLRAGQGAARELLQVSPARVQSF